MLLRSRIVSISASAALRHRSTPLHAATIAGVARFSSLPKGLSSQDFEFLIPAMQVFHAKFGHFAVPYNFRIGARDTEWPEQARGMNAGRRFYALMTSEHHRKRGTAVLSQLEAIGVPVETDWRQFMWEKTVFAALKVFHRIHGHSIVPLEFVVPSDSDEWPVETRNFELGKKVASIRQNKDKLTINQCDDLAEVFFTFDVDTTIWLTRIMPAFRAFKEVYKHVFVSRDFRVPSDPSWPQSTWGLRLGSVVHTIRNHGAYKPQIEATRIELEEGGWVQILSSYEENWSNVVLPALVAFHTIRGHAKLPPQFIIPSSEEWPRSTWGFNLGRFVHTAPNLQLYREQLARDRPILIQLGLPLASYDDKWDKVILPALEVFVQVHGCESTVPFAFTVPSESPWPQAAWGLHLGTTVSRMRTRNQFNAQRQRDAARLTALSIDRVIGA